MDDSKQKSNDVIDLVGESDDINDDGNASGTDGSGELFLSKSSKKRRLVEESSKESPKELPCNAEVIDLVDDFPASGTAHMSTTIDTNTIHESHAKDTKKRPRDSGIREGQAIAKNSEIVDLVDTACDDLLSGSRDRKTKNGSSTNSWNGRRGSSGNESATIETNIQSIKQEVILEPSDSATLTNGMVERIHMLSINSYNKCWTCLGWSKLDTSRSEILAKAALGTPLHIRQNDMWSCGYRNYQMLLSALLPRLSPHHFVFSKLARRLPPTPTSLPSVLQIQASMEGAWNHEGFDPDGANHYRQRIRYKKGNVAKIGAMEVANLCWYHGIDAVVIQCIKCSESRELLPFIVWAYFVRRKLLQVEEKARSLAGFILYEASCWSKLPREHIAETIWNKNNPPTVYHDGGSQYNVYMDVTNPPLLPLYLQWEGHSVTVVGIEVSKDQKGSSLSANFLVLDPLKETHKLQSDLRSHALPSSVKLPWKEISNKDLQIIVCTRRSMPYVERQLCKSQNGKNPVPPRERVLTAAEDVVQRHLVRHQY